MAVPRFDTDWIELENGVFLRGKEIQRTPEGVICCDGLGEYAWLQFKLLHPEQFKVGLRERVIPYSLDVIQSGESLFTAQIINPVFWARNVISIQCVGQFLTVPDRYFQLNTTFLSVPPYSAKLSFGESYHRPDPEMTGELINKLMAQALRELAEKNKSCP